jgi:hypothetical protein
MGEAVSQYGRPYVLYCSVIVALFSSHNSRDLPELCSVCCVRAYYSRSIKSRREIIKRNSKAHSLFAVYA